MTICYLEELTKWAKNYWHIYHLWSTNTLL